MTIDALLSSGAISTSMHFKAIFVHLQEYELAIHLTVSVHVMALHIDHSQSLKEDKGP